MSTKTKKEKMVDAIPLVHMRISIFYEKAASNATGLARYGLGSKTLAGSGDCNTHEQTLFSVTRGNRLT